MSTPFLRGEPRGCSSPGVGLSVPLPPPPQHSASRGTLPVPARGRCSEENKGLAVRAQPDPDILTAALCVSERAGKKNKPRLCPRRENRPPRAGCRQGQREGPAGQSRADGAQAWHPGTRALRPLPGPPELRTGQRRRSEDKGPASGENRKEALRGEKGPERRGGTHRTRLSPLHPLRSRSASLSLQAHSPLSCGQSAHTSRQLALSHLLLPSNHPKATGQVG